MTLTEMAAILSNYFPPSDKRLYALNRLGIRVLKVHHTLRKKKLVADDRGKLIELYRQLD